MGASFMVQVTYITKSTQFNKKKPSGWKKGLEDEKTEIYESFNSQCKIIQNGKMLSINSNKILCSYVFDTTEHST